MSTTKGTEMTTYQMSGSAFDELLNRSESKALGTLCRSALDQIFDTQHETRCGRGTIVKFACTAEHYQTICDEILTPALRLLLSESDVCSDFKRDAASAVRGLQQAIAKAGA